MDISQSWTERIEGATLKIFFCPEELREKNTADPTRSQEEIDAKAKKQKMIGLVIAAVSTVAAVALYATNHWIIAFFALAGMLGGIGAMMSAKEDAENKVYLEASERYIFLEGDTLWLPRMGMTQPAKKFQAVTPQTLKEALFSRPVRHSVNFVPVGTSSASVKFTLTDGSSVDFSAKGFEDIGGLEALLALCKNVFGEAKVKID